jgi:hypothetical protein
MGSGMVGVLVLANMFQPPKCVEVHRRTVLNVEAGG